MKRKVLIVADKNIFMKHWTGEFHPESPRRVEVIEQALKGAGFMRPENSVSPRQATGDEITLCHDISYQEELKRQIERLDPQTKKSVSFDQTVCHEEHVQGDFQISRDTLTTSLYAAGAPLTAIEYILEKKNGTNRAFCIVRPPGHHAHRLTGSGFCVFNNVAIAAKFLTERLKFDRVLIVDWDAHHGDGTQALTQEDSKIFYFSTHQDTSHGFYPGSYWGREEQKGVNGTLLNCPVSGSKSFCRQSILNAFRNQLVPAMEIFQPDFVLISCGFDAHENDSLVGLGLKDEDFGEMTNMCIAIAEKYASGRIVSVLEGGYHLDAISNSNRTMVVERASLQLPGIHKIKPLVKATV